MISTTLRLPADAARFLAELSQSCGIADFASDFDESRLEASHHLISALSLIGLSPYERFRLHRAVTARWLYGRPTKNLAVGFYTNRNRAVELSLFHGDDAVVPEFIAPVRLGAYCFIGLGLAGEVEPMQRASMEDVRAMLARHLGEQYDPAQTTYDLGWEDSFGSHVETVRIDPSGDIDLFRESMSGRTAYGISLDAGGGITILSAGGMDNEAPTG